MNNSETLGVIGLTISVLGMIFCVGMLINLEIKMYFLNLNINNHPTLIKIVNDALTFICKSENLPVFNKTFEKLNEDETSESEKSLGLYVRYKTPEAEKELDDIRKSIEEMELKHHMRYETICMLQGVEPIERYRLSIPRIELAENELMRIGGKCGYYQTWLHEIGHHMALKEFGENGRGEENAEIQAAKLIKRYLPSYFQLFARFYMRFEKYAPKLTFKEKFFAYINFLLYLIHERKTKLWQKNL